MAGQITRKATADKINSFRKKAQEELDEGIPEEDAVEKGDETEGEEPVEEPVEEEVVEEEAPPQDLEERVDELEETQKILEEGLEEHKEILEQVLDGGEGEETTFEDFLEDTDKEIDEEEISSDEMGLEDDDFLTASKEGTMSLRALRNARLKQAAAETETIADQWELEKDKKKRSGPIQPEVPKGNVPKHEMPELFKVSELSLEQTDDKQAWLVLDKKDRPLCALRKGSISDKEFASENFAKKVILDMYKMGIKQALKKYKAVKYVTKTASKVVPVDEKKVASANNDFKRRYVRAVRLALNAMNKNLVKEIPLKAAFYEILHDLEVPQADKIIETAFAKASVKHFEAALANAERYLAMSDDAFVEVESNISGTEVANISSGVEEESPHISARAEELRKRASDNSLPFGSSTEEDPNDKMAALERALPKPKLYKAASLYSGKRS